MIRTIEPGEIITDSIRMGIKQSSEALEIERRDGVVSGRVTKSIELVAEAC